MLPECNGSPWTRIDYLDVFPHESQQQRLMRKDMHGRQWEGVGGACRCAHELLPRRKDMEGSGRDSGMTPEHLWVTY